MPDGTDKSTIIEGIQLGLDAASVSRDIDEMSDVLDRLVEKKAIDPKERDTLLNVRSSRMNLAYGNLYNFIRGFARDYEKEILQEDPYVDFYLSNMWQKEPLLAGAVYTMSSKMVSLNWFITGRKRLATRMASMLSRAAHYGGYDWAGFISSSVQDFNTTNRGVFWETPRHGNYLSGRLADIGHVDTLACTLTGNARYPVWYWSPVTSQQITFRPGEYIHFASMPSPREEFFGTGFCAVARAHRAARLLIGLHDYDQEKLANLPPEGVAAVSGLTMDEFMNALELWKVARQQDDSLTFPQVLWLVGSQPNAKIAIDFAGFSQLPESFDRKTVVTQYVNLLALDFGVDAREFWPVSSGALGTASESEIQHMKARGKGPGEFIKITERIFNGEMPEGVEFTYDTQDIEEDSVAAANAQAWISAFLPLVQPLAKGMPISLPSGAVAPPPVDGGEGNQTGQGSPSPQQPATPPMDGIISKDDFLRLLADKNVIPDYMVPDNRIVVADTDTQKEFHGEFVRIEYNNGILRQVDLPPIQLRGVRLETDVPYAQVQKGKADAPNYRQALENSRVRCSTCKYAGGIGNTYCTKFDFTFENGFVCDAWEPMDISIEKGNGRYKEEGPQRNIKGKPIPQREVERGTNITQRTVASENEVWRSHPLLQQYALSVEEAEEHDVG